MASDRGAACVTSTAGHPLSPPDASSSAAAAAAAAVRNYPGSYSFS